ncbi:hypothetical protein [Anoxynatronum buryatiense]|uniref:LPXTG cell wall anchor domain-containing protein n=1 Tax=Anoxynatronum buryatiense TaxID=489973 RepID=A0AA46AKB2_9CLOT|nr:hypothetical protein [Anoxynatronum buryatiense]SMP67993.1 hypothetical protein SAMN06296020_11633 [Anoxynatronum buryatiense]
MTMKRRPKKTLSLLLVFWLVSLLTVGSLLTTFATENTFEADATHAAQIPATTPAVISSVTVDETAAGALQPELLMAASSSGILPLLPQTGNLPPAVFYLLGLGLAGIGMAARKSKTQKKTHQT